MTFTIICILIGCALAALAGKAKAPKAAAATTQTTVVATMDEDTEEAINAIAEYAIALSRRAEALNAAARDESDPVKASKLRADAARITAQSAAQSLKAAKLAKTINR